MPASPLLAELAEGAPAAGSAETMSAPPLWSAQQIEAPVLEELVDERAPAVGSEERTHGVATLRSQSQCPFRGFAETRLDACVLEQPIPGFNERERGQILHDALQGIFTAVGNSRSLQDLLTRREASAALIADHIGRAVDGQCAKRNPGARWAERERTRLQGLLERWLELESRRAPFQVEHVEGSGETAVHGGLAYQLRIDRIDRLEDGSHVLIDYKSGWVQPDWRGERPDNPQLPMYALRHRENTWCGVAYGRVSASRVSFRGGVGAWRYFPGCPSQPAGRLRELHLLVAAWERARRSLAQRVSQAVRRKLRPRSCLPLLHLQGLCRVPSTLDALEPFAPSATS